MVAHRIENIDGIANGFVFSAFKFRGIKYFDFLSMQLTEQWEINGFQSLFCILQSIGCRRHCDGRYLLESTAKFRSSHELNRNFAEERDNKNQSIINIKEEKYSLLNAIMWFSDERVSFSLVISSVACSPFIRVYAMSYINTLTHPVLLYSIVKCT